MVQEMSLKEANEVKPEDLLAALGGLPEEKAHCAELAVNTPREAIPRLHADGAGEAVSLMVFRAYIWEKD